MIVRSAPRPHQPSAGYVSGEADSPAAARHRHPCTQAPVPGAAVRRRVATELEAGGTPHADVAASVLAVRGGSGLAPAAFARRCGVPLSVLTDAEAGRLARDQLPGPLRRMVPA